MTITISWDSIVRLSWHILWFAYGITIGVMIERYKEER